MTNFADLPHKLDRAAGTAWAIIETPKGARSKFDYDQETGLFEVKTVLPEGMSFPLSFGFFPATKAEDGDPLDVLVLHDEPLPTGSALSVRLIGVIEAEQTEKDGTNRNDRLLAVSVVSHLYEPIDRVEALGDTWLEHLNEFWVNYNRLRGRGFKVLNVGGPARAIAALEKASQGKR